MSLECEALDSIRVVMVVLMMMTVWIHRPSSNMLQDQLVPLPLMDYPYSVIHAHTCIHTWMGVGVCVLSIIVHSSHSIGLFMTSLTTYNSNRRSTLSSLFDNRQVPSGDHRTVLVKLRAPLFFGCQSLGGSGANSLSTVRAMAPGNAGKVEKSSVVRKAGCWPCCSDCC